MELNIVKAVLVTGIGITGSIISYVFGGWNVSLETLILFMAFDYITGLILAAVFKKSKNTQNGGLESKAGFKGLCKKGIILFIVLIAHRLDMVLNTTFIMNAVVIAYIANETISIIENVGLMGVPIPDVISKAIDILKKKSEEK